ncbi:hypothetical protein [Microseira sp. BLCC-F43]|jgi:G3E family GTPase|uniref:hypothetical protein n=1 Tax=Microseira sp. BLCC-F43 TaxID=3153602 RepID=UPI0035B71C0B
MEFRVSKTSGVAHVDKEFGSNVAQFGNLTPEQVHEAARQAKILNLQRQLGAAMVKHLEKIYQNKAEIERLTLEAMERGLEAKEEIDKYVQQAIVASAKHNAHIQRLNHQMKQELQMMQGQLLSDKALATASFQQRLHLLRANHQAKSQIALHGFQQRLKEIQASPALAIAANQRQTAFTAYINTKDYDPILANFSSQRFPGGQQSLGGGGFLSGLLNFFTGK